MDTHKLRRGDSRIARKRTATRAVPTVCKIATKPVGACTRRPQKFDGIPRNNTEVGPYTCIKFILCCVRFFNALRMTISGKLHMRELRFSTHTDKTKSALTQKKTVPKTNGLLARNRRSICAMHMRGTRVLSSWRVSIIPPYPQEKLLF